MGISLLKIPKICEHCGKPFEAKTVATRFCSPNCANKSGKEKKRQAKEAEHKQTILEQSVDKIAQMQTRLIFPFLRRLLLLKNILLYLMILIKVQINKRIYKSNDQARKYIAE